MFSRHCSTLHRNISIFNMNRNISTGIHCLVAGKFRKFIFVGLNWKIVSYKQLEVVIILKTGFSVTVVNNCSQKSRG